MKTKYILVSSVGGLIEGATIYEKKDVAIKWAKKYWKTLDYESDDVKVFADNAQNTVVWMPPKR